MNTLLFLVGCVSKASQSCEDNFACTLLNLPEQCGRVVGGLSAKDLCPLSCNKALCGGAPPPMSERRALDPARPAIASEDGNVRIHPAAGKVRACLTKPHSTLLAAVPPSQLAILLTQKAATAGIALRTSLLRLRAVQQTSATL